MPTYLEKFSKALDLMIRIITGVKLNSLLGFKFWNNFMIELIIANNSCIKIYKALKKAEEEAEKEYNKFDHSVPSNEAAIAYCKYAEAFSAAFDGWKYKSMTDWIYKWLESIYRSNYKTSIAIDTDGYMQKIYGVYLRGAKISNRQRKQLIDQGVKIYN